MANSGLQPVNLFLAIFPSVLCVVIVSIRVWMKLKGGKLGIEDTLLIVATFLNLVLSFTTCGYILTAYYGYHSRDIPLGAVDPVLMMKWNYANSIIYNPILALIKASFILTLIKLRSQNRWINACLWATLALNACFAIGAPLACIFQCNPVAKYYDNSIPGKCVDPGAYTVSTSSIVLTTDVLVLLMPSWILSDLKMPLGRKLMVIAFLSFGVLVTVVGAVRTRQLVKMFVQKKVPEDPTYEVNYILSNIESGLAIIGTCGPTIKYMLSCCIPSLRVADESSNRAYRYPTGGSEVDMRSRRFTKSSRTHNKIHEIDEMELTRISEERKMAMKDAQHGDPIMITKTVAWTVDNTQGKDSNSTNEEHAPRGMV